MLFSKQVLRVLRAVAAGGVLVLSTACSGGAATPAGSVTTGPDTAAGSAPNVVSAWREAWVGRDPAELGALFTVDGTYRDLAFEVTWRGPAEIATWKQITDRGISGLSVTVDDAFRDGDHVAIQWTFAGTLAGAPRAFSVPAATVLRLDGDLIAEDADYYNRAAILAQSGLPPNWTPPGA